MKEFENQNITLKDLFEREQEFSQYCMETRNKNCFKGFVDYLKTYYRYYE
jgi:hypothetical protein